MLDSGQQVPAQAVKATAANGHFKGTINGTTLKWTLTFAKLTGPAKAAYIHLAAKGAAGSVVVVLCGPCTDGVSGSATITSALMHASKRHLLYVSIHTAKNPRGEIRGQISSG
jgi:hypothetical protein